MVSFRLFLESDSIPADIPLDKEVYILSELFHNNGANLYVVGGIVRDYLYQQLHAPETKLDFDDIDLVTDAQPEKIKQILGSDEAKKHGIRALGLGESFGIIVAVLNGKSYDIATYREDYYDPEKGDGRHPDTVTYSSPQQDAKRRDFTINALYYDIHGKRIIDHNIDSSGKGMGIQDIRDLRIRPVGEAKDRFREDKLRILRAIRFFNKWHGTSILKGLEPSILSAIKEFDRLDGVSKERIIGEFTKGFKSAINIVNYLVSYAELGLFSTVFPGIRVNLENIENLKGINNLKVALAWMFRDNPIEVVRKVLHDLKYSGDIVKGVVYLMDLMHFDPQQLMKYLAGRRYYAQDVEDLAKIAPNPLRDKLIQFIQYQPTVKYGDKYAHLSGEDIKKAMERDEIASYLR